MLKFTELNRLFTEDMAKQNEVNAHVQKKKKRMKIFTMTVVGLTKSLISAVVWSKGERLSPWQMELQQ